MEALAATEPGVRLNFLKLMHRAEGGDSEMPPSGPGVTVETHETDATETGDGHRPAVLHRTAGAAFGGDVRSAGAGGGADAREGPETDRRPEQGTAGGPYTPCRRPETPGTDLFRLTAEGGGASI